MTYTPLPDDIALSYGREIARMTRLEVSGPTGDDMLISLGRAAYKMAWELRKEMGDER